MNQNETQLLPEKDTSELQEGGRCDHFMEINWISGGMKGKLLSRFQIQIAVSEGFFRSAMLMFFPLESRTKEAEPT